MPKQSKTDWARLDAMKESQIDYSDIPELDDDFFNKAHIQLPKKQSVTIRLDSDVLAWFKRQGKGYQSRINKLLRVYMDAQQVHK